MKEKIETGILALLVLAGAYGLYMIIYILTEG